MKDQTRPLKPHISKEYSHPKEFGEFVLDNLTRVINARSPPREVSDTLEREQLAHETFAVSKYSTRKERVYIWRQAYFNRLDANAEGNELPLVILGESGAGKFTLHVPLG